MGVGSGRDSLWGMTPGILLAVTDAVCIPDSLGPSDRGVGSGVGGIKWTILGSRRSLIPYKTIVY